MRVARLAVAALLAASLMTAAHATAALARRVKALPPSTPVAVYADQREPLPAVPSDFLGLSFEVAALPQLAGYAGKGDLVALMRSLGGGVVRFGGVTADEDVGWSEPRDPPPRWASSAIEPGDFDGLGELAGVTGWHVLLTLGFGHYEPQAAAHEAASARAALGSSLEAIEIGNEPDSYARHRLREAPWTFVQYDEQVSAYRGAIEALAPGIPLAGPDTSGSDAYESWGLGEAIYQRPTLLTGHHYPLSCNESPPPSIERLLSPHIRELEEGSLKRYLSIANDAEIPFRLDETGSVSCGGVAGVSDTFASTLWALAYITRAMTMGISGINFEGNPDNCGGYTPLCAPTGEAAASGELQAQPEWYALLAASSLVGERPLHVRVSSPEQPDVVVGAFLAADGTLRFVLVDEDPPGSLPQSVSLHVGEAFHGASVLSLQAPAPSATSGVTLGGRAVEADGLWTQPATLPRAPNRDGTITVRIAPSSAALLTAQRRG